MKSFQAVVILVTIFVGASAFTPTQFAVPKHAVLNNKYTTRNLALYASPESDDNKNIGIIELDSDETNGLKENAKKDDKQTKSVAPFISQGEIQPESLNPDLSDPKQTRVIIYMIVSLLPVLFLIPLMLGSRELIPLDALPPVQM